MAISPQKNEKTPNKKTTGKLYGLTGMSVSYNEASSLYQIGEYAKSNKTVINILAVEGETVGLPHVQVAAEISGGTVNVLNPLEIVRQLRQIMQNSLVATSVTVTFFLHPDFIFDEPGYPDVCTCMCVCVYVCVCVRVCGSVCVPTCQIPPVTCLSVVLQPACLPTSLPSCLLRAHTNMPSRFPPVYACLSVSAQ